jgi:hypothetical protein
MNLQKKICDATDEELLMALIKRNELQVAPSETKRYGLHWASVIGIGNDHTAFITLYCEDLSKLKEMTREFKLDD